MKETKCRGFSECVGKTIESIDTGAINAITIIFTDGTIYEINAEDRHCGVEIIKLIKKEVNEFK